MALRDGGWLEANAMIAIEEAAQADVALPDGFAMKETRRFGDTQLLFAIAL
jgi:16S rRNA (guanine966-N2)-methyltransferase